MSNTKTIMVAIHTDGMGTFQPRCMGCAWKGQWVRKEATAVKHGKTHTNHKTNKEQKRGVML